MCVCRRDGLPLADAAHGHALFNDKQDEGRKVVLTP